MVQTARRCRFGNFHILTLLVVTLSAGLVFAQPAAPDLEVSDIVFSTTPTVGVSTTATAVLRNIGGVPSGPFNVQWVLNDGQVGFDTIAGLAPGQTAVTNVTHTFTPAGTFTIRFWADPSNALPELDELNNLREETITPQVLQPDLSASAISLLGTPRVGDTITVIANVSNIGSAVSPAIPIRWLKNSVVVVSTTLPPLANGFSTPSSWQWTPTSVGAATIIFEADAGNTIAELDESNNNSTRTVTVEPALQPDLAVGGITFSTSSPQEGAAFTMTASMSNIGSQVSPALPIEWRVNGAILSSTTIAPLANGDSQSTSFTWTPNFSGSASFTFTIDPAGVIAELNESNNTSTANLTIASPPRPDITVSSISVSPSPVAGQTTTVSIGVNNIGNAPSVPSISLRLLVDGAEVAATSVPPLASGSSAGASVSWTPSLPGTRTLRVEADYTGVIDESNESNNSSERSELVAGPDLTASGISFAGAPTVGEATSVTASVSNLSGVVSPAIPIQWRVDGVTVASDTLAPLAGGDAQTASFSWSPSTPGAKTVQLVVDPANTIAETNEANNQTSAAVDVADVPRADLRVVDIALSDTPSVGAEVILTATLRNDGLVDSGPFQIRWSVNGVEQLIGSQAAIPAGVSAPAQVPFAWTPGSADEGSATVSLEVDILDTVDESNEANNRLDEGVVVLEPQFPTIEIAVSTNALSNNAHGWYAENPVHASATIRCPASASVCDGLLRISIASSSGSARFYVYDDALPLVGLCTDSKSGSDYSHTDLLSTCVTNPGTFAIVGGQTEVRSFDLWVQPTAAATLEVAGTWGVAGDTESIAIDAAQIQPMVFIHGILGSMPPVNMLIDNQNDSEIILDPFIGGYAPILANAQKMGYEWNKSLFAVAYDWRQSNRLSAGFLAEQMRVLMPRARAVDYVWDDAGADLIVHSMGGMVSRAYVQGQALNPTSGAPEPYQNDIRKLVFVASPHRGFPFDYQTYEGMTWKNYLYDAPLMAGGKALGPAMDSILWPTLAAKKYEPTKAELQAECEFLPFVSPGPLTRLPYHYLEPGFIGPVPGAFACGPDVLTRWGQHPSRGILSLLEMLPTDDFVPTYLTNLTGVPPGRPAFFPWGRDANTFLNGLNADIGTLVDKLGLDNIHTVYGYGADTDLSYEVDPPPAGSGWRHGQVVDSGVLRGPEGDDLVPSWSASLDGLVSLSPSNRVQLNAAPAGNSPGGSGRHKQIIAHPELQQQHMPSWFTGMSVPFSTAHSVPLPTLNGLLALVTACPIDMLVEVTIAGDTLRVGYDPVTGESFNEVPGAIVTAAGVEPQIILIPGVDPGDVRVLVSGYDTGEFQVSVQKFAEGLSPVAWLYGTTSDGQVDEFIFENEPDEAALPVAVDDAYGVERDTVLTVGLPGVLANDSDLNGASLVAELVDDVSEGILALEADGSFIYTPPAGFLGRVEFTYRVVAEARVSEVAVVSIAVNLPNIAPVAQNDSYEVTLDTTLETPAPGVLGNDSDENDDDLTAAATTTTAYGTLTLVSDGSFIYVPDAGYIGPDSFTYRARDGFYDSNVATVTLQVLPPNQPPVASDDVYRMELSEILVAPAPGVMANDSDPDGDSLTVSIVTGPQLGTVTLDPDGGFVYEGGAEFNGVDGFTYLLSDGQASVEARVFIRPPADCEDLFGFDVESDEIVRIDPATGASLGRIAFGVDVTSVAMAFDSRRRLWLAAQLADQPSVLNVYRVELDRDRIRHKYAFEVSTFAGAFDLNRLGATMGPDGKTLFVVSGSTMIRIGTRDGELSYVPRNGGPLGLDSEAIGLPGRCQDLIAYDTQTGSLVRVSRLSGELEPIGSTGLTESFSSLAGAADGTLYGLSAGNLYRFDVSSGNAAAEPVSVDAVEAIAFQSAYSKYMCLDKDYDRKTKLSRYVVKLERGYHSNGSSSSHRCERHGKKNCSTCKPLHDAGKCGEKGFYRLRDDGRIWIDTDDLPVDGVYRIRVQYRSRHGKRARLRGAVGEERFTFTTQSESWRYSRKVKVRLSAGVNRIRFKASEAIDIERVHIERDCPEGCSGPKLTRCLDTRLAENGLSKYVVKIEGQAGHRRRDGGCCGSAGYYWVKGGDSAEPGRITAELEVPEDGRYAVRFQYRVGDRRQEDESIRLSLGGQSFDFLDEDLENTQRWTWSERIEVGLTAGLETIVFLSIGRDSVHFERVQLEKLCDCGPPTPDFKIVDE